MTERKADCILERNTPLLDMCDNFWIHQQMSESNHQKLYLKKGPLLCSLILCF